MRIPGILKSTLSATLLLILWIVAALWAQTVHAALPPGPLLLLSGETVRTGRIPTRVALPTATLHRSQIEPAFVGLAIEDDAVYVWSASRSTALRFDPTQGLLPGPLAAVYTPDDALLAWANLETSEAGAPTLLRPVGPAVSLATFLETPGSFAVVNTPVLPAPMPVPEPGFGLTALAGCGALLARARTRLAGKA